LRLQMAERVGKSDLSVYHEHLPSITSCRPGRFERPEDPVSGLRAVRARDGGAVIRRILTPIRYPQFCHGHDGTTARVVVAGPCVSLADAPIVRQTRRAR